MDAHSVSAVAVVKGARLRAWRCPPLGLISGLPLSSRLRALCLCHTRASCVLRGGGVPGSPPLPGGQHAKGWWEQEGDRDWKPGGTLSLHLWPLRSD